MPEQRLEVVFGDGDGLLDGAHRVVEAEAAVPDRVPDRVGQLAQFGRAPVVQQHEVEVGVRGRFAAAEAADRDQREPVSRLSRAREQRAQPAVVSLGQRRPQLRTGESGPAQHAGPDLAERLPGVSSDRVGVALTGPHPDHRVRPR